MKKKKIKLSMILCVLIIGFLLSSSSLNINSTKNLVEGENNQFNIDSFDSSAWTLTEVVSTVNTEHSYNPSLVTDSGGNIHIAWHDATDYAGSGTDTDIFYKRWNASSSSWTLTEVVSTESTGSSAVSSLAVDSTGNVHIAWEDFTDYAGSGIDRDIFYKRWNASSSSWTLTEVVSTESNRLSYPPSLAVDTTGDVHIAWHDRTIYAGSGGDEDIFYKRWNASSSSWTLTEVVSSESTSPSYYPSLAVDTTGNVHIAWHDYTTIDAEFDYDIFYKRWNASSSSWTLTEVVSTESTSPSYEPSLAVDSTDNIHITWYEETDYAGSGTDRDIFYKRWNVYSSSWTTTEVVSTESTYDSYYPSLAIDSIGNIHIMWHDWTDYAGSGGDTDIFYKRWNIYSSSWTTTEVVSTESTNDSYYPSLDVDTLGNVHVAWQDLTDYAGAGVDRDIFYKLLGGPPAAPKLSFIVPNPTELYTINLDWNNVFRATTYYIYRSTSYVWSVIDLIPIATLSSSEYIDTVPSEGYYYYVIIAGNVAGNSSHSNCQYVEVK
ncbi:MAG: hypothetical protein KAU62_01910, partial [Candidatus Heimdallarchaeota archaeon]|nr:hypothetical protein [Candidatus Heimdallarchaeota archaeon]MCK4609888.1 hypothetical protein [Candidatus Heimdallarchaeota archaeon]